MFDKLFNSIGDELADPSLSAEGGVLDVICYFSIESVCFNLPVLFHDLERNFQKRTYYRNFLENTFPHRSIHYRLVSCVEISEGRLKHLSGHDSVGEEVVDDHFVEFAVVFLLFFVSNLLDLFVDSFNGVNFRLNIFNFATELVYFFVYFHFKIVDFLMQFWYFFLLNIVKFLLRHF